MNRSRSHTRCLFAGCLAAAFAAPTAIAALPPADLSTAATAPFYSAAGIVQAASQTGGAFAPNSIATLYGTNLSWTTHALAAGDMSGAVLPRSLDGVSVYVDGLLSGLFFVSPGQINFLIPGEITGSTAFLYIVRQGLVGPTIKIPLAIAAPGLFQWNENFAIAQHADGTLISPSAPAKPGEVVVLYATGLGRTIPESASGHIASTAATILDMSELQILLNNLPCDPASVYYAGVTPGFAGLYQINLRLPPVLDLNSSIQVVMGAQSSPPAIFLFTQSAP
jgi:uncharacterized protein (TIGR03437 family)